MYSNSKWLWLLAGLASMLAFWIELAVGKDLLPTGGGTILTWGTAMVFFQSMLLVAYYIGPVLLSNPNSRNITTLFCLLPLIQPLLPNGSGFIAILMGCLPWAGPLLCVFCVTPLLHRKQQDGLDYRIYSWSNLGAILGLIIYPWLIEPHLGLDGQRLLLVLGSIVIVRLLPVSTVTPSTDQLQTANLMWFILPCLCSAISLATVNSISLEFASGPLVWSIVLILFLLSYVVAFQVKKPWTLHPVMPFICCGFLVIGLRGSGLVSALGFVFSSGLAMFACNMQLARCKSSNSRAFYIYGGLGGLVGTGIVAFLCPIISSWAIETPLLIGVSTIVCSMFNQTPLLRWFIGIGGTITTMVVLLLGWPDASETRYRSWYGCLSVKEQYPNKYLCSGHTIHGAEGPNAENILYYGPNSGIGQLLTQLTNNQESLNVLTIGLGAGTINQYARHSDSYTFIELDPQVVTIAKTHFHYLTPETKILIGDGRKVLEHLPNLEADVLIVDAFSGDAIPMHLLTREAAGLYIKHLKPGGIIAVHITNKHIDLDKIVHTMAQELGYYSQTIVDPATRSTWVIFAGAVKANYIAKAWTDNFNSLWPCLSWHTIVNTNAPNLLKLNDRNQIEQIP